MAQILIFGSVVLLVFLTMLLFKNKDEKHFRNFLKWFTIVYMACGFFRFFLSDSFINIINSPADRKDLDLLQVILRWGYYSNYAILPMAVFFKNRMFRNMASYFSLIFSILSVIFYYDYMPYFLGSNGSGLHLLPWIRYLYFGIELTMACFIPIIIQIKEKHVFNVKNPREWINLLICLPLIVIQMMPVYIPQHLIGYTGMSTDSYDTLHIIWMSITLLEFYILYKFFSYRCYNDRYMICVFLSIVLFYHYDSLFLMGITLSRLPVQLCNIAAYFFIICIPLKLKKMFNFCFICNIVGTVIAIVTPDFSVGALGFWNMHYMYEHMLVLIVPALAMGLRIFPRVNRRSLLHMFVGFTCYFTFCLIVGTIINGYSDTTGQTVNYFFLFDMEKMYKWLPFLEVTERFNFSIGKFDFYPVYIIFIYMGFLFLCILFYWFVIKLYEYIDDHHELRKSRIDLYQKITGKKSKLQADYID